MHASTLKSKATLTDGEDLRYLLHMNSHFSVSTAQLHFQSSCTAKKRFCTVSVSVEVGYRPKVELPDWARSSPQHETTLLNNVSVLCHSIKHGWFLSQQIVRAVELHNFALIQHNYPARTKDWSHVSDFSHFSRERQTSNAFDVWRLKGFGGSRIMLSEFKHGKVWRFSGVGLNTSKTLLVLVLGCTQDANEAVWRWQTELRAVSGI